MRFWQRQTVEAEDFESILARCLERATSAEALRACLAEYPQQREQLEPLLTTALRLRGGYATPLRDDRRLEARRRYLQAAARQAEAAAPAYVAERTPRGARTHGVLLKPLWSTFAPAAVAAALFVGALLPILSLTSNSALPGDWNYGFKRSSERVRLALAPDPHERLDLQLAFHQRRLQEIERLASEGRLTDPNLLRSFDAETTALVNTVKANPALGPTEAQKVAQATQDQAQALQSQVEPRVPQAVQPAVVAAVDQSQQASHQATLVVQAKAQAASSRPQTAAASTASASATADGHSNRRAATPTSGARVTPGPTASGTPQPSPVPSPTAPASATADARPGASVSPTPAQSPTVTPTVTPSVSAAAATATPGTPVSPRATPILLPALPPPAAPTSTVNRSPAVVLQPPAPSGTGSASAAPTNEPVLIVPGATASTPPTRIVPPVSPPAAASPSPTPAPQHTPLPTPSPAPNTPTPSPTPLVVPPQPPASSSVYTQVLPAGVESSFRYIGPTEAVPQALSSINGAFEYVFFTQPSRGGYVYTWIPGESNPLIQLERGSFVTVKIRPGVPVTLSYRIMP